MSTTITLSQEPAKALICGLDEQSFVALLIKEIAEMKTAKSSTTSNTNDDSTHANPLRSLDAEDKNTGSINEPDPTPTGWVHLSPGSKLLFPAPYSQADDLNGPLVQEPASDVLQETTEVGKSDKAASIQENQATHLSEVLDVSTDTRPSKKHPANKTSSPPKRKRKTAPPSVNKETTNLESDEEEGPRKPKKKAKPKKAAKNTVAAVKIPPVSQWTMSQPNTMLQTSTTQRPDRNAAGQECRVPLTNLNGKFILNERGEIQPVRPSEKVAIHNALKIAQLSNHDLFACPKLSEIQQAMQLFSEKAQVPGELGLLSRYHAWALAERVNAHHYGGQFNPPPQSPELDEQLSRRHLDSQPYLQSIVHQYSRYPVKHACAPQLQNLQNMNFQMPLQQTFGQPLLPNYYAPNTATGVTSVPSYMANSVPEQSPQQSWMDPSTFIPAPVPNTTRMMSIPRAAPLQCHTLPMAGDRMHPLQYNLNASQRMMAPTNPNVAHLPADNHTATNSLMTLANWQFQNETVANNPVVDFNNGFQAAAQADERLMTYIRQPEFNMGTVQPNRTNNQFMASRYLNDSPDSSGTNNTSNTSFNLSRDATVNSKASRSGSDQSTPPIPDQNPAILVPVSKVVQQAGIIQNFMPLPPYGTSSPTYDEAHNMWELDSDTFLPFW